ncbi:MAG: FHA domain-containing protein, partial [Planctomycetota bacterium]|nr:FHA domain-containing protein [Planctomycetota bacterium]
MPRPAELIFVAGAQAGQRTALMTNPVVGGRGSECDVRISEECVSRKAFTLTLRRDGWIFENLTTRKMEVSGKSYKPGKELILETGDVICPGVETRLLFVSADDDAEAALTAYRAEQAKKAPPAPEPAPSSDSPPPSPRDIIPMARASVLPEPSLAVGAEVAEKVSDTALRLAVQAKEKAAKRRKYLVAFSVYAAVMVGVLIMVSHFRKPGPVTGPAGAPHTLTNDEVGNSIRQAYQDYRLSKGRETLSLDAGKAADCLKKARILWANRAAAHGNPYDSFRNYKLYMAYSGLHIPKDAKDVDDCDAAKSFLIDRI